MEQPQVHEPVRDTRTIRKAATHHPMRPLVVGIGVVAVLGGVIVAASRYERAGSGDPAAPVSSGAMHVEETQVLPPGLAPAPKPEADARGTGPVPVRFYEALDKGSALGGGEIAMRSMPLPPAADDGAPAPRTAPQAAAPAPVQPMQKAAPAPALTAPAAPSQKAAAPPVAKPAAPALASAAPKAPPAAVGKPYTLQVGSFSDKGSAQELVGRLKGKGHEAYLAAVDMGSKGTWYRVRVGRFPTEHAARWARLDLVREGLSPIVVHDPKGP